MIFRSISQYIIILICVLFSFFGYAFAQEHTTRNETDAMQLGRKVLFAMTPDIRDQLIQATSAQDAVDILFPDQNGPSKTMYDAAIASLISTPGFILEGWSNHSWANRYYHTALAKDPYEAKAKLSLLRYDVFAVNREGDVRISDIVDQQRLIYQYSLGNYKTLIQRHLFNNTNPLGVGAGGRGDYAVGRFIDLLRQNIKFPNENYARELMQLFLMGEYDVLSDSSSTSPNYTDEDVVLIAKKLTGLEDDPVSHQVTFNPSQRNMSSGVVVLSGQMSSSYQISQFPYWDQSTDTMDFSQAHVSILGNNGLMDNTIEYIFAKREATIARYIAFKLYKYYIDDRVKANSVVGQARGHIQELADQLIAYDFELLPTIKRLLTREWLYDPILQNIPENKNPVELAIGTIKLLNHRNDTGVNIHIQDGDLLTRLGWIPYYPGSIFGRDGFDDADVWLNDYSINVWLKQTSSFAFTNQFSDGGASWTGRFSILGTGGLLDTIPIDPLDYIADLENIFYGTSGILPTGVRDSLESYLTSGGLIPFDPTNSGYVDTRMRGLVSLILAQPEYLLKQGLSAQQLPLGYAPSQIAGDHKIIFLELFGGYDWLFGLIPRNQYLQYVADRSILAVPFDRLIQLGMHFMNVALQPFVQLYQNNELILINGVGNPGHSRGHDTAQRQSTSANNRQAFGTEGLFGSLIKNDDPANTYVLGLNKPNIFSLGRFTNIGPSSSALSFVGQPWNVLSQSEKNILMNTIRSTIGSRSQADYPGILWRRYEGALSLDNIAGLPGPSSAGRTLSGQLAYVNKLLDNNMGHAFYAVGGHGFDTHANQQSDNVLQNKMSAYAQDIRYFFDQAKTAGHDVTIVVHTEFGRTIKRNGSDGTDHGEGGGYFIITNNPEVQNAFPDKVYGRIDLENTKRDWLGVGIDYRSVYKRIFGAMYNIVPSIVSSFELDDEVDTTPPRFTLLHPIYKASNDRNVQVTINAQIYDKNYLPKDMAGHVWAAWGSTPQNTIQENLWHTQRNIIVDNTNIRYQKSRESQMTGRYYILTGMDNQHILNVATGTIQTPRIRNTSQVTLIDGGDHIFRRYDNTSLFGGSLVLPTPIQIASGTYIYGNGYSLEVPQSTQLVAIAGSGLWNGGFLLPQSRNIDTFIHPDATYLTTPLDDIVVRDIVAVGPDSLGIVGLLDTGVVVHIPYNYTDPVHILFSTGGLDCELFDAAVTPSAGTVQFETSQLGLFALVDTNAVDCDIIYRQMPGDYAYQVSWSTTNAISRTLQPGGLVGTSQTGGVDIIVQPNQEYTYTLEATNGTQTHQCTVSFAHLEQLSRVAPNCTLQHALNADGSYTLSRSFVGGSLPLSATLQGNQDVGDITNLLQSSIRTIPPANASTTYTLTTRGIGTEQQCATVINTIVTQSSSPSRGSSGGGGSSGLRADQCDSTKSNPLRDANAQGIDYSASYYDSICGSENTIIKPLIPKTPVNQKNPINVQQPGQIIPVNVAQNQDIQVQLLGMNQTNSQKSPRMLSMDRILQMLYAKYHKQPKQFTLIFDRLITIGQQKYDGTQATQEWKYFVQQAHTMLVLHHIRNGQKSSSELITWMFDKGFTQFSDGEKFQGHKSMTRQQFAKMAVVADKIANPDKSNISNTLSCRFSDRGSFDSSLAQYVVDACQRGLMQGVGNAFLPREEVSYAQAMTVVERIIHGSQKPTSPRRSAYVTRAFSAGYVPAKRPSTTPKIHDAIIRIQFAELIYNAFIYYQIEKVPGMNTTLVLSE